MKKIYSLLICILTLFIAAAGFIPAVAYNNTKQYGEGIIEYNLQKSSADSVQEWINSDLTRDAGAGSEWYIIALSNHGKYDFSKYKKALDGYLSENEVGSASSRLKYALTYIAISDKANPYINKVVCNSIGEQGIMSLVFGLHLLNNGCVSDDYSLNGIIDELLSLQLDDGGWSISGEHGDIDTSAMIIQALSPHYHSNSSVKSAINNAIDFLSVRQNNDGSYSSYGISNPESISQVIIALASVGIDAETDSRFIKNGNTLFDGIDRFRLPDGSYSHKEDGESNSTATVQVLCAAIAYENMKNGKAPFYILAEDENVCETIAETATVSTLTSVYAEKSETKESTTYTTIAAESASNETTEITKVQTQKKRSTPMITAIIVTAIMILIIIISKKKSKLFNTVLLVLAVAVIVTLNSGFSDNSEIAGTVTISIRCDTVKDSMKKHIPSDGIVLEETEIEIENGDTVYDVFSEACKENDILFSANMKYIEGINNLYEMDFGKSSGWIYFVNGESPSVGCGNYELVDGDEIEWHYTCNLGIDIDIDSKK